MRPSLAAAGAVALSLAGVAVVSALGPVPGASTPGLELARPAGAAALAVPGGVRASGATLEQQARGFLRAHAAELALGDAGLSDLELRSVRHGKAVDVVRFRQTADGVPVLDGEVAVTLDRGGAVVFVANGYRPVLGAPGRVPALAAGRARAIALTALGGAAAPRWESLELAVVPAAGRARLAWRLAAVFAGEPTGEWEVLVDAATGELLRVEDIALHVDGTGQAFSPNPLASATTTYGTPGYVDGGDADTPELVAELFPVGLLEITDTGSGFALTGPWAECLDFEAPTGTCPLEPTSDFSFASRSDDRFEAVNVYYHIDSMLRYLNVTLGLDVGPTAYATGVLYDPRGLSGQDNSHYLSGPERLAYGEGGVDDAEDADVVIHELGHGIHDWVTNNSLSQVEGLSEGLGDYWAVSWLRSFGHWQPGDPQYNWVFGWDGHNPFWSGRVTTWNDNHHYPEGLVGQIHTDGQFWSSCNMDVWEAIGREATDTAMVEGISMTNSASNQRVAAQALLTAAVALGYPAADLVAIDTIYDDCGYQTALALFVDGFESGDSGAWSLTVP
jgi:hypothetical protein